MRRFALSLLACLWASLAAAQAPALGQSLTPEEMRQAAGILLQNGQVAMAAGLAEALVTRDPNDAVALKILAAARTQMGQAEDGQIAAKRAFQLAGTDAQKYQMARLTALAAFRAGRGTTAQYWLRRANGFADSPRQRAQVAQDFRHVRAGSRTRFRFSFDVAPSDNVNRGTYESAFTLPGVAGQFAIGPAGQALSGVIFHGTADLSYRLSGSKTHETRAGLTLSYQGARLSGSAKAAAPTVNQQDFTFLEVEVNGGRAWATGPTTHARADIAAGQRFYGGSPLEHYLRIGGSHSWRLEGVGKALTLGTSVEQQWRDNGTGTSTRAAANITLRQKLGRRARLTYGVSVEQTRSDIANRNAHSLNGSATLDLGRPVGGLDLSVTGGLTFAQYPDYAWGISRGRKDRQVLAKLDAGLTNISVMGYMPTVSLSAKRTRSSVSFENRKVLSLSLGIRSEF